MSPIDNHSPESDPTTVPSPDAAPSRGGTSSSTCVLPAEGMDCPSCASTATKELLRFDGVHSVDPDIIGQKVTVSFDADSISSERLQRSLRSLGYGTEPRHTAAPEDESDTTRVVVRHSWATMVRDALPAHVALGGAFWALTIVGTLVGDSEVMVGLLAGATIVATGWKIFPRAFAAAIRLSLDMHVLMAVAALGALAIGEYVEAGAVLFLFAVARELEHRTLERARSEVRSLMDLAPVEATVLRHGHQVRVPVDAVRRGEIVLVRPGERVPVDGSVVSGSSEVDSSAITGESMPEAKFKGDGVFAGSVNGSGALELVCDRPASESALGRILGSIEAARSQKSPTEAFIDRFARIYTPAVMLAALLVAVAPPLLGGGAWAEWGYRALVLVVIACPCALVISTPVTVVSALTGAARRGILVKSGVHLEILEKTRVVALDKTGTITEGTPLVSRVVTWRDTDARELLRLAAATESRSEHPIARAILAEAGAAAKPLFDDIRMTALPGRGARAEVADRTVLVGSPRLFEEEGLLDDDARDEVASVEADGGTIVLVGWSDPETGGPSVRIRGAIALTDRMRPGVPQLVDALHEWGVKRVVCMSGDRSVAVASSIRSLDRVGRGIDEWRGNLLPEEKVEWIRQLRSDHGQVLMIGDGVNDAPALAAADIGIAMAGAGTAMALDTADIALMEDELSRIPEAFALGRKSARIIRYNIAFALAVKVVFVALGSLGLATLWMAVVADMGSSLAVILNGLRALRT